MPTEKKCTKCGHIIPLFATHLEVKFQFMNREYPEDARRFCSECSKDNTCAVLFRDVLEQPLSKVMIKKVWG